MFECDGCFILFYMNPVWEHTAKHVKWPVLCSLGSSVNIFGSWYLYPHANWNNTFVFLGVMLSQLWPNADANLSTICCMSDYLRVIRLQWSEKKGNSFTHAWGTLTLAFNYVRLNSLPFVGTEYTLFLNVSRMLVSMAA